MTITLALTDQDKATLRTAAYGAVALLSAADATGKPHKIATTGSIALSSAIGATGHVLAAKTRDIDLYGKSVAELADRVLPALTQSITLLNRQDPAEADNFRGIVLTAIEAATQVHQGRPGPVLTDMIAKIAGALDAA
ncbi:D-alanyl-D-alanine carboxypeptidase [[Actinomadura] parvosata subsp. kistnae]|uniref:D-alanyl-D-alanine carboxypeptidase n=1 Tax=[Actinomadura] parvosata subsp. kistnae TaxID=1909395 RepID=A0A1V0AC34_9ACTN|nr:hypothetical protein [Nonomuraea sp. ATCC 55076]AQZ67746.1 hypothetical protein BKM31_45385 [Nonomuraea sp. ATCC 55076]SPL93956.1 D-alanyl-D-alanine carboxypeptidase [Actinomadura parvosata subsp. kistnae]